MPFQRVFHARMINVTTGAHDAVMEEIGDGGDSRK
jgi:hypothetical protein